MTARSPVDLDAATLPWGSSWECDEDLQDRFRRLMPFVPATVPANGRALRDVLAEASAKPVAPEVLVLARAFYRVREAACEASGVSRREVRPDTRLDTLLPAGRQRRVAWRRILARLGSAQRAELDRPAWMEWTVAAATIVLGFTATAIVVRLVHPRQDWLLPILITALIASAQLLTAATRRWAVLFRAEPLTAGDLARAVVSVDAVALALPHDRLTRAQIEAVRRVLMTP